MSVLRRSFDLTAASVLLVVLAPLLALIAIAVALDSRGSPFFRQRRVGREEKPFTVHKFRTMISDADPSRHRDYVRALIRAGTSEAKPHKSEAAGGCDDGLYKLVVDPRITRVGRFLRRFSLDELPQLWNVVRGEMSLVGPRPVIPYELQQYPDWYRERFAVKPGLTGLWQVNGRNERTYEEMVELDIAYVRDRALLMDLRILLKTALVVVRGRGAA